MTITTPNLYTLNFCISGTDKIVVRSGGMCHRRVDNEKVFFTLDDPKEIQELRDHIQLKGGQFGVVSRCMCCGGPTFEFYKKGKLLTSVSNQHCFSLRWSGWFSDAHLTPESGQYLKTLFQKHGLSGMDYGVNSN